MFWHWIFTHIPTRLLVQVADSRGVSMHVYDMILSVLCCVDLKSRAVVMCRCCVQLDLTIALRVKPIVTSAFGELNRSSPFENLQ